MPRTTRELWKLFRQAADAAQALGKAEAVQQAKEALWTNEAATSLRLTAASTMATAISGSAELLSTAAVELSAEAAATEATAPELSKVATLLAQFLRTMNAGADEAAALLSKAGSAATEQAVEGQPTAEAGEAAALANIAAAKVLLERKPEGLEALWAETEAALDAAAALEPKEEPEGVEVDDTNYPMPAGTILVAHPDLLDPSFAFSVILILSRSGGQALGVNLAGSEAVPGVQDGGPMMEAPVVMLLYEGTAASTRGKIGNTGYCLTVAGQDAAGTWRARGDLSQSQVDAGLKLFGTAGWGPGQLEMEAGEGFWITTSASLAELLSVPADQRWELASSKITSSEPDQG